MKIKVKFRILEQANELIDIALSLSNVSIACGNKPTARCKPPVDAGLTLRKVSDKFFLKVKLGFD